MHILASADRQIVLDELLVRNEELAVETLSEIVAARRHKLSPESVTETMVKQAQIRLVHEHLPTLADAGIINVSWSTQTITLCDGENTTRLLETAAELDNWPPADLQEPSRRKH